MTSIWMWGAYRPRFSVVLAAPLCNLHKNFGKIWKKFVQLFLKKNLTMVRICGKIVAGLRPRDANKKAPPKGCPHKKGGNKILILSG